MNIGGRDFATLLRGAGQRGNWIALVNMLGSYEQPLGAFRRYLLASGTYPMFSPLPRRRARSVSLLIPMMTS